MPVPTTAKEFNTEVTVVTEANSDRMLVAGPRDLRELRVKVFLAISGHGYAPTTLRSPLAEQNSQGDRRGVASRPLDELPDGCSGSHEEEFSRKLPRGHEEE